MKSSVISAKSKHRLMPKLGFVTLNENMHPRDGISPVDALVGFRNFKVAESIDRVASSSSTEPSTESADDF
jgi:hypothetical protein